MASQISTQTEPFPRISCDDHTFSTFDSDATIYHVMSSNGDEEPLYTEINIPLPRLPSPPQTPTNPPQGFQLSPPSSSLSPPPSHSRSRSRSLSAFSLSPFRSRSSSTSTTATTTPERLVKPSILRSREVAAAMDLEQKGRRGRSSTIDALAVVPAVLVLSAELFTPGGEKSCGRRGKGRKGEGLVGGMR
ncbi:hypothetical protein JI435_055270 [Parastagonospora nodorum SN15]|uniref:Uncharacterized protein n=1 Tax=Phaeosphaeria nodorum (strain SN15 / ATCC MYA-4574 / FGSC 10173) TaxID=321614 RepID=A0A7U2EZC8_PHANO|nr:hypothetical protein JI435_055270 [Parastagonospora nodorum SN15]